MLAEIKALSEDSGWCFAGNKHFADWLVCGTSNISNYIQRFQREGMIEVTYKDKKTFSGRRMRVNLEWFHGLATPYTDTEAPYTGNVPPFSGSEAPYTGAVTEIKFKSTSKLSESEPPAPVEIPTLKEEEVKRGLVALPPAASTALTYDQYPNPRNSQQLKEAMRNYFVANPREWQDGVLEQSRATNWTPEKIQDCITAFCAHQEGEGNLKRTYGQYKGMMVKWFLAQPGFDKAKPGASASSQQQAPSNIPSSLQGLIGK